VHFRSWLAVIGGLLAACSSHAAPPAQPAPIPATKPAPRPVTRAPAPADSVRPTPKSAVAVADTTAPAVGADPDSVPPDPEDAADAAVLEKLATVHPSGDSGDSAEEGVTPGGANETKTPASWDIDVTTFGSHARVQFYLDFFQTTARDRFTIWLQRMPRYETLIRDKLKAYGLPEDMVYLALIESGFSNGAVSRSRAVGMWQFMKGTGRLYGLTVDSWVDERRDPIRATDAAARHLADLRERFGSLYLAAAAYNAGAGKVTRGLRRLGRDEEDEDAENADARFFRLYDTRYLRRETKDYVPKLIAAALIAKEPEKYGFPRTTGVDPLSLDSMVVADATGLDVVARLADTTVAAIRDLNPQLLRAVSPPRRAAVIRLPAGTGAKVTERYATLDPKERVSRIEHVVTRGQTVASIARLYGVSSRVVLDANPEVGSARLHAGTRLVIPTSYAVLTSVDRRSNEEARAASASSRHRVRAGENLGTIARRYRVSVRQLRTWNAIGENEVLRAGQTIWVRAPGTPPSAAPHASAADAKVHVVHRGETLSEIAAQYGLTIAALRAANGMEQGDVLKAGTRLKLP
jgi:peptidoglycan lytic transglycosylase D